MKQKVIISNNKIKLRSINESDIETIRKWKNKNSKSFFYKKKILPQEQKSWYKEYLKRKNDYILIIEDTKTGKKVGCIGYRKIKNTIDLYNLIVINKQRRKGYMTSAVNLLETMLRKKYKGYKITVFVIPQNNAINWYIKNNFDIIGVYEKYICLELRKI